MNVAVVIPTYNEKENIVKLIRKIIRLKPDNYYVLVVDDNSPDGTGEVVEKLAKKNEHIEIIHRQGKLGLGTAYVEGFKRILKRNKQIDYIVQMDADLSHDPKYIKDFLNKMKEYDLVVGSRYLNGISVINWPLSRLILSLMANWYARMVTGLKLVDTTTGYKCFRREVLERINLDKVESSGYSFQVEMNYRARKLGYRIGEASIVFVDRNIGSSKMSGSVAREALFILWKLKLKWWEKK